MALYKYAYAYAKLIRVKKRLCIELPFKNITSPFAPQTSIFYKLEVFPLSDNVYYI